MRINVIGKGRVQGVNGLLPVYNIEKSESEIRGLICYRNIRVYDVITNLLITQTNVNDFFSFEEIESMDDIKPIEPSVEEVVETQTEKPVNIPKEKKSKKPVEPVVVEESIEEEIVEVTDDEIVEEEIVEVTEDEIVEEVKTEMKAQKPFNNYNNYKGKKKK